MSIREEARRALSVASEAIDRHQRQNAWDPLMVDHAKDAGEFYALTAALARAVEGLLAEQDTREPSERFAQTPAVREVIDTLDYVSDRMDEFAYGEIRTAVESIPECETYTAIPHEEHGEPSDAYVKTLTREFERIWDERADDFDPEVHDEYQFIEGIMRAALLAAQAVRRG